MKKIIFASLIFLLSATNVFAFKKGSGFIEGSLNFNYTKIDTLSNSTFAIGIGGGAFLTNDFSLSGSLSFSRVGTGGNTTGEIDLVLTKLFSISDKIFYSPNVFLGYVQNDGLNGFGLGISLLSFDYKFNDNLVLNYRNITYSFSYLFADGQTHDTNFMINTFSLNNNHSLSVKYIF